MDSFSTHADHGIITRQSLLADGMTREQLALAQQDGTLTRLTRSLFATRSAHDGVAVAVRARGSLTCISALRLHDVWTLSSDGLHHIRRTDKCRRRGAVEGAVECRSTMAHRRVPVDSLDAALMAVVINHSREDAVVALDCVLHSGVRDRGQLENLMLTAPADRHHLLSAASGLVESPLESLLRFGLWQRQVKVKPQAQVPGVGRVDFLIGKRLIIEVDSVEFHTDLRAFRKDRERDRRAVERGYKVLRFTTYEVQHELPRVLATILRFVRRDLHRPEPKHLTASLSIT